MTEAPTMSVVIPTFNRRDQLVDVLRALAHQDTSASFEVIVVSDGSTDGTDEYLRSDKTPVPIVTRFQQNRGPAAARNVGIASASGEYVVFLDDDVVAGPSLLRAHLDAHRRLGDAVVVIGPMRDPDDRVLSSWVAWEQEMLAKQYDAMERGDYGATARQFYTGNASVRLQHLRATGGFDTSLKRAEDIELAFRLADAGLSFFYEPTAVGFHYAERPYRAWRTAAQTYGRNDIIFARDYGRSELYPVIAQAFRSRHWGIRALAHVSATSSSARIASLRLVERAVQRFPIGRWARVVRYALSAVYAIEYYGGTRDEIGSARAFRALMRGKWAAGSQTENVTCQPASATGDSSAI